MKVNWIISGSSPAGFSWSGGETVRPDTRMLAEAIIGDPNFKAIWWLESAIHAARSVARVKLAAGSATGFLIAPDILMTNNHVFEDGNDARHARIQFNYRLTADGDLAPRDEWECDPDDLFKTNAALDYSIVRMKLKDGKPPGDTWGFLNLRHGVTVNPNQRVNIIQHPQGRFQEIVFRDNQVKDVRDTHIQYLTDTDYGTSGSPVFDDWFNVVALHNQRVPDPNDPHRWYRNHGFRVEAILADAGDLIPAP
ncbi:MAG: serine protease [Pseudomonadota bacterium]